MHNPQPETFLRVADAGSVHKAAEGCYIPPDGGNQADGRPSPSSGKGTEIVPARKRHGDKGRVMIFKSNIENDAIIIGIKNRKW